MVAKQQSYVSRSAWCASVNAWRKRHAKFEEAALFWCGLETSTIEAAPHGAARRFCSLGYMAPWTFIGSLIAFFKASRNANFYARGPRPSNGSPRRTGAAFRSSSTASTTSWACP